MLGSSRTRKTIWMWIIFFPSFKDFYFFSEKLAIEGYFHTIPVHSVFLLENQSVPGHSQVHPQGSQEFVFLFSHSKSFSPITVSQRAAIKWNPIFMQGICMWELFKMGPYFNVCLLTTGWGYPWHISSYCQFVPISMHIVSTQFAGLWSFFMDLYAVLEEEELRL